MTGTYYMTVFSEVFEGDFRKLCNIKNTQSYTRHKETHQYISIYHICISFAFIHKIFQ